MAEPGQEIEGFDSTIRFVETTAETDGERLVVEIAYAGSGAVPPSHFHPTQTENFEVLEGEIHVKVGDSERTLRPGDELEIPPGTPHQMWCDDALEAALDDDARAEDRALLRDDVGAAAGRQDERRDARRCRRPR